MEAALLSGTINAEELYVASPARLYIPVSEFLCVDPADAYCLIPQGHDDSDSKEVVKCITGA